jgi:hypothetical protein
VKPWGERLDACFQVVAGDCPQLHFCAAHLRVGSGLE